MSGSQGDVGEVPVTYVKQRKGCRMNFDVGEMTEGQSLILQAFRRFSYVTAHAPTLPSFHLRHNSFHDPSVASPTSQALHLRHLASRPCLKFSLHTKSSDLYN